VKKKNDQESEFLKESLKQRPLNRRKLLRRMLLTVLMAVIFGTVASVTIILLEPLISERLYPEEEPPQELIIIPEDIIEEEILPEDMIADEREMQEIQQAQEGENNSELDNDDHIREIAAEVIEEQVFGIEEYLSINEALLEIAREARKSLVTVTGLTSDINMLLTPFESRDQTTGIIVGSTAREVMVLANIITIRNADIIVISFANGRQYQAEIKRYDRETGLAILSIRRIEMDANTLQVMQVIELGNSSSMLVTGTPIIAIGRVVANSESTSYGYITSAGNPLNLVDSSYKMLTTDIYGSTNASGILINMQGQVIGIINNNYNTVDARNIVSAIGISELKKLIETMCNNIEKPYFGIIGMDVTMEAHEVLGVPLGTYVREVRLDTPAMEAGIQSGDIIVKVDEAEITGYFSFVSALFTYRSQQTALITVMRQGPDRYLEFKFEVVLESLE
jgi:serine protease Do